MFKAIPKEIVGESVAQVRRLLTQRGLNVINYDIVEVVPSAKDLSEEARELMKDPKYWRDHEPNIVRKVEEIMNTIYNGDK